MSGAPVGTPGGVVARRLAVAVVAVIGLAAAFYAAFLSEDAQHRGLRRAFDRATASAAVASTTPPPTLEPEAYP